MILLLIILEQAYKNLKTYYYNCEYYMHLTFWYILLNATLHNFVINSGWNCEIFHMVVPINIK